MRLQARNWNRANVTELDEQFQILPLMPGGDIPSDVPRTGEVLRRAPRKLPQTSVSCKASRSRWGSMRGMVRVRS